MNNLIQEIKKHNNLEEIYDFVKQNLFMEGPSSITTLEILSYLNLFAPEYFQEVLNEVLEMMGIFYKKPKATTLKSSLFEMYGLYIKEKYNEDYTPVQADIVKKISDKKVFSFSAPTSTGKSFVFRHIIKSSKSDVAIIVPSRALINEYYDRICNLIQEKSVNILTFVDIINTKYTTRNIFILTPERAKELFKFKEQLNIEIFLFDEAQLSDEESVRGLYFDSIVRRVQKAFPLAKCVFAHPFVSNPEAQLLKNKFDILESSSLQYTQKNVGQIFFAHDGSKFYHFGIDKNIMGNKKILSDFDPIMKAIKSNGSVLVYVTKSSIYDKSAFEKFSDYIKECKTITTSVALNLIEQLKKYIGANEREEGYYFSNMIEYLKKGIVIHHGSLPLQARLILEHFTQQGFCRICFATSTLEQGINMPFDVVYLNTFQASKPLSLKNLIGRAGRSTNLLKFDYGSVVIKTENMSNFRNVMTQDEVMKDISLLDTQANDESTDYEEFKEAINSGEFSDEYNLTNTEVLRLNSIDIESLVQYILDVMFINDTLLPLEKINKDTDCRLALYGYFRKLYEFYLDGRALSDGEESVLDTAIKILLWKIYCKTFKDICWYRYAYVARVPERRYLEKQRRFTKSQIEKKKLEKRIKEIDANFIRGYDDLPNSRLSNYGIFPKGTKAHTVDYDRIMFDTYDYLDKLIGFKLSDIFYAIFYQYYEKTSDKRAFKLAQYFKYGTDDSDEIWMLRYGFSFEDIEWLKNYINSISQVEIVFNSAIKDLPEEYYKVIERFV